jgi:hypothetical protein
VKPHVTEPVVYLQQVPVLPEGVLCLLRLYWHAPGKPCHLEEVAVYEGGEGHAIVQLAVERAAGGDFDLTILTNHDPEHFGLRL